MLHVSCRCVIPRWCAFAARSARARAGTPPHKCASHRAQRVHPAVACCLCGRWRSRPPRVGEPGYNAFEKAQAARLADLRRRTNAVLFANGNEELVHDLWLSDSETRQIANTWWVAQGNKPRSRSYLSRVLQAANSGEWRFNTDRPCEPRIIFIGQTQTTVL